MASLEVLIRRLSGSGMFEIRAELLSIAKSWVGPWEGMFVVGEGEKGKEHRGHGFE